MALPSGEIPFHVYSSQQPQQVTMVGMTKETFDTLMLENKNLKLRVAELEGTVLLNIQQITNKNTAYDLIRAENDTLRAQVKALEEQNAVLKEQKLQVDQANGRLSKQLKLILEDRKRGKFMNALQDANAYLKLEQNLASPVDELMKSLHIDRIGENHYIYKTNSPATTDSTAVVTYKLFMLLTELKVMPNSVARSLRMYYSNFINDVTSYIENMHIPPLC